jgi:hypothetical protein
MAQGVWDKKGKRFKSKKALRDEIAAGGEVYLEATSVFGNEWGGALSEAPDGDFFIVGPCPYRDRRWYAHVTKKGDVVKVK